MPILIAGLLPTLAVAATYRCGNTYTDRPCQMGQAVDTQDDRSASQMKDALDSAREARAASGRMQQDRLRQEATAARQGPALIGESRPAPNPRNEGDATTKKQSQGKAKQRAKGTTDDGSFRAIAPGSGKTVKASRSKARASHKAEG